MKHLALVKLCKGSLPLDDIQSAAAPRPRSAFIIGIPFQAFLLKMKIRWTIGHAKNIVRLIRIMLYPLGIKPS